MSTEFIEEDNHTILLFQSPLSLEERESILQEADNRCLIVSKIKPCGYEVVVEGTMEKNEEDIMALVAIVDPDQESPLQAKPREGQHSESA